MTYAHASDVELGLAMAQERWLMIEVQEICGMSKN
jgi:hypothetical protein